MITYRANDRWTLHAAYCGSVRIGYVEDRERFTAHGWRWQLILLQPEGGAYWGFVSDEGEAKAALEQAFTHWLAEAGLQQRREDDDIGRTKQSVRRGNGGGVKDTKRKGTGTSRADSNRRTRVAKGVSN